MATSSVLTTNPITTHSTLKATSAPATVVVAATATGSSSSSSTNSNSLSSTRKRSYITAISIPNTIVANNSSSPVPADSALLITAPPIIPTAKDNNCNSSSSNSCTMKADLVNAGIKTVATATPALTPADYDNELMSIHVDASVAAATIKAFTRTISQSDIDLDAEVAACSSMFEPHKNWNYLNSSSESSPVKRKYVPPPMPNISSGAADLMTICKPAPFSGDEEATLERERCDYTQRITYQMARSGQAKRRVRVYADGIYDLFHQGHARQLMQAKNIFPNVYLIVGVCNDELTHTMKGRTVMNDYERYEGVRHCRYVDEIVPNAPWTLSDDFIADNKIDFVAHDDIPYTGDGVDDIYAPLKAKGMFVATERTEGVSTSDIVARIVKDYDLYVRRNLARGYSAKDLNVSFLSEKKFRLQNKMDELKDRGRRELTKVKDDIITKWEEKSREFIDAFLLLFGRDRLNNFWNESKGKLIQALSPPGSPVSSIENAFDEDYQNIDGDTDNDSEGDADADADVDARNAAEQKFMDKIFMRQDNSDAGAKKKLHLESSPKSRRSYHHRRVVHNGREDEQHESDFNADDIELAKD